MTTNVLIINRQLVFAVTIKQALEQTGLFAVHPFTSADAALDFLRSQPHDVALVDFTLPDYNGPQLVRRLRAIQPGIAVIVSPSQPNARDLIRELDLQGVIDAPFSARAIIPLIEHAVEQIEQPLSARTRSLIEEQSSEQGATDILVEPDYGIEDELPPPPARTPQHTRTLTDDEEEEQQAPPSGPMPTRIFDDLADEDDRFRAGSTAPRGGETRILDDDDAEQFPWERPAGQEAAQPDFSTLDSILMDEASLGGFEPPVSDEDTPSVPTVDSDAVRQFLATGSRSEDDTFGSLLGNITPESEGGAAAAQGRASSSFDDLVNSMRADRQHTPLPDRHQQFIEFILTGGMDTLLSEIEKAQTGPLEDEEALPEEAAGAAPVPDETPDTFTVLAQEEPPLPTLEENGTIGDLMVGVSDSSFRNVLAMMRGETVEPGAESEAPEDPFADFFGPAPVETVPPDDEDAYAAPAAVFTPPFAESEPESEAEPEPRPQPVREPPRRTDDSEGIPARLILETALDESTPADSFSLDNLIENIERQLTHHRPDIKPLPSWGDRFRLPEWPEAPAAQPADDERFVREPDFLAGETAAPPQQAPAPLPSWEDEEAATFETTVASQAQRDAIEAALDFQETEMYAADAPPAEWDEPVWAGHEAVQDDWEAFIAETPAEALPPVDESFSDETLIGEQTPVAPEPAFAAWTESPAPPADDSPELFEPFADEPSFEAPVYDEPAYEQEPEYADEPEYEEPAYEEAPVTSAFESGWALLVDQAPDEETTMMEQAEAETYEAVPVPAEPAFVAETAPVVSPDDPYIAQLALSLTQVSLELTAEATLLTHAGQIVAFAGTMAPEDMDSLRDAIGDDWEAGPDEARIRFLNVASTGREYMLYSRRTVGDFTLSMIFGGTTPLRDIRRQGKRLMDVLATVPEMPLQPAPVPPPAPAVEAPAPPETGPLTPYTYMWLLADPEAAFDERASQVIVAGLQAQLREQGWQVRTLRAQDEYVYVFADIPGESTAYTVAEDLKRRAEAVLRMQGVSLGTGALWADSYLVMTPGRELDPDEIHQFINFERLL